MTIHYFPGAGLPAEAVLDGAKLDPPLDTVLVIGKMQDGRLYMAWSTSNAGEIMLLLARGQRFFLDLIAREAGDD